MTTSSAIDAGDSVAAGAEGSGGSCMWATSPAEATKETASTRMANGAVKSWMSHPATLNEAASATDAAAILKGMQIVHDQLIKVLQQQEVQEIAPSPGDAFNPNQHEALMQQETSGKIKPGHVTQLLQKGYAMHDRMLRPAQVAVAKSS